MKTVKDAISDQLSSISEDVNARVIKHFVEAEAGKRSDAIIKAMNELRTLENDLRKIKPDNVLYSEEGKEVQSAYSKAKLEERKKLTERIDKYKNALDAAIDKGDMDKVYKL